MSTGETMNDDVLSLPEVNQLRGQGFVNPEDLFWFLPPKNHPWFEDALAAMMQVFVDESRWGDTAAVLSDMNKSKSPRDEAYFTHITYLKAAIERGYRTVTFVTMQYPNGATVPPTLLMRK